MFHGSMSIKRKLFHANPTMTVENYSVMGAVLYLARNEGIVIIGTNARNRFPKDIEPFYLYKDNMNVTMKHAKAS